MPIEVRCPNGHLLKVSPAFAGRWGLCPVCREKVKVPRPQNISDDDIADFLSRPGGGPSRSTDDSTPMPERLTSQEGGTAKSYSHGKEVVCPKCAYRASQAFAYCTRCGAPLAAARNACNPPPPVNQPPAAARSPAPARPPVPPGGPPAS